MKVFTEVLPRAAGAFTLTLPVGATLVDVDPQGTLDVLGDQSLATEERSFYLEHKNVTLPSGTLTPVGWFRLDAVSEDHTKLFLFEVS